MRRSVLAVLLIALIASTAAGSQERAIVIGAIFPTGGPQGGPGGGSDEYHGLLLAADYVNAHGGVNGRPVQIRLAPADSVDAAPGAVEQLAKSGVPAIVNLRHRYRALRRRDRREVGARLLGNGSRRGDR